MSISLAVPRQPSDVLAETLAALMLLTRDVTKDELKAVLYQALEELK